MERPEITAFQPTPPSSPEGSDQDMMSAPEESGRMTPPSGESPRAARGGSCPPAPMRRTYTGVKRPRAPVPINWDLEDEDAEAVPDLGEYFADFTLSAQDKIALCRTYANHLSAMLRMTKSKR